MAFIKVLQRHVWMQFLKIMGYTPYTNKYYYFLEFPRDELWPFKTAMLQKKLTPLYNSRNNFVYLNLIASSFYVHIIWN